MKLAYPIATPEVRAAIFSGIRGAPDDVLPALRDAGYAGIEPFVADPTKFDAQRWASAVERSGLEVVAVGTGPLVFDDSLSFTAADAGRRRLAVERTKACVAFAARFGAQLNIGKLRGDVVADNAADGWAWMREAIAEVCSEAARQGIAVTLEPQGRPTINTLNTAHTAIDFVASLAQPNLRLMLDTFHMAVERGGIRRGGSGSIGARMVGACACTSPIPADRPRKGWNRFRRGGGRVARRGLRPGNHA